MTSPQDTGDCPSRASSFAAVVILLLIFLTPAIGFWWLRDMAREAGERSALAHTRDMLIRHVARTRGAWPASWNDMQEDFKPADADYGTPDWDVLKRIVEVDFAFNPESLAKDRFDVEEPPRVVWLKDRPDTNDVRAINASLAQALRQRRAPKVSEHPER